MKKSGQTCSLKPVQFRVDASKCGLCIGDAVTPDTVVGADIENGEAVKAGCHGKIMDIRFSGGEHALTVIIQPTGGVVAA